MSQINTLLFSGGGTLGIAYIGVVKALEKTGLLKNIKTFCGTSIGSIFALIISMNYKASEIQSMLFDIDMEKAFQLNVLNIIKNGVYGNDEYITQCIKKVIKIKFSENITFKELFNNTGNHLIVNTTCLCDNKAEYFDYIHNPDMEVWLAIRMSISIPYIFPHVEYKDKYYVDGGLCKLPFHLFEEDNLLAFIFTHKPPISDKKDKLYFIKNIYYTYGKQIHGDKKHIVKIDVGENTAFQTPDKKRKFDLIKKGLLCTIKHLHEYKLLN
jgi:predicted patatin/cPLA2 family phospholipase